MRVFSVCVYVCAPYACLVLWRSNEGARSPRTGIVVVMSCHVNAGHWIWIHWKASNCSETGSHRLSSREQSDLRYCKTRKEWLGAKPGGVKHWYAQDIVGWEFGWAHWEWFISVLQSLGGHAGAVQLGSCMEAVSLTLGFLGCFFLLFIVMSASARVEVCNIDSSFLFWCPSCNDGSPVGWLSF